jgi:hypothetical protein
MSRFQKGSLLKQRRKNGPDIWVFRWYDETSGKRTYKKRILGTVGDLPLRRDAEQAVADFRANINVEVRVPQTVSDLAAHYRKHELTSDKKAFATIESTSIYLSNHVVPKWGDVWLSDVRTVEVEQWLHSLPYAPATRSKSATLCRRCSIMASGMNGYIGIPSPKSGPLPNGYGNRTCFRQRSCRR